MKSKKYVECTLDLIQAQTEKAVCVSNRWFPKSQLRQVINIDNDEYTNVYIMLIPLWLWMKSAPTLYLDQREYYDKELLLADDGKACGIVEKWIMKI